MGSLFNGVTGGGGGQGNNCKSLTTRSGSSLKLDDSAGSVTLHDKGGVSMNFDGAGNQTLATKASATTTVGKDASLLQMDKDGNIELKANTKITLKIEGSKIIITKDKITLESSEIEVNGTTSATVNSPSINMQGGTTNITSTTINLKPVQPQAPDDGNAYFLPTAAVNIDSTKVDINGGTVEIN